MDSQESLTLADLEMASFVDLGQAASAPKGADLLEGDKQRLILGSISTIEVSNYEAATRVLHHFNKGMLTCNIYDRGWGIIETCDHWMKSGGARQTGRAGTVNKWMEFKPAGDKVTYGFNDKTYASQSALLSGFEFRADPLPKAPWCSLGVGSCCAASTRAPGPRSPRAHAFNVISPPDVGGVVEYLCGSPMEKTNPALPAHPWYKFYVTYENGFCVASRRNLSCLYNPQAM